MADLLLPNIVGQYEQGYDRGRGQLADRLAGQAFSTQGADRQSALSRLAGVNPQAAFAMQNQFAQQDQLAQQQAQAQQIDHNKKLNGAARYVLQAVQSGDPNRVQGAWSAVRPYLADLTGKQPPEQFDPAMLPKMYEIVGQTGGAPDAKGTVVAPGGVLVDSATGQQMFSNPASPAKGQLVDVPDGKGGSYKMIFDPATGQLSQPNFGASGSQVAPSGQDGGYSTMILPPDTGGNVQPLVTPSSPFNERAAAEANAMLAQHVPPDTIMQRLAAKYPTQRFDIALDRATGQFKDVSNGSARMPQEQAGGLGYNPGPQKQAVTLSPAELKAAGLPDGTVAQRDENGKITVVSRPPQVSPDKMADIAAKRQKAQAAQQDALSNIDDNINQIDELLNAPGFDNIGTFTGDTFGRIPHTDTADARAKLETVGNQSLLTTLSSLKSLSATGASGFGALSDSEGRILRNAAANLNESQSNAALRKSLQDYKSKLLRTRQRLASLQVSLPEDSVAGNKPIPQQSSAQGGQDFSHLWGN